MNRQAVSSHIAPEVGPDADPLTGQRRTVIPCCDALP